jgi:hypothetical protein
MVGFGPAIEFRYGTPYQCLRKERSHCGPHGCWIVRIAVRTEDEDSVHPRCFSGSDDRTRFPGDSMDSTASQSEFPVAGRCSRGNHFYLRTAPSPCGSLASVRSR